MEDIVLTAFHASLEAVALISAVTLFVSSVEEVQLIVIFEQKSWMAARDPIQQRQIQIKYCVTKRNN